MRRGEIWLVNMEPAVGSEIRKVRPAVVIQNEKGLSSSNTVIVAPLTSQRTQRISPSEVFVPTNSGLLKPSKILCNQLKSIDKTRLERKLGKIPSTATVALNDALKITLDLY